MKQFTFQVPTSGIYNIQLSIRLEPNQQVIFGKYAYKRKITREPKWWQFWFKTEIIEETIPVEIKPEDIVYLKTDRPTIGDRHEPDSI